MEKRQKKRKKKKRKKKPSKWRCKTERAPSGLNKNNENKVVINFTGFVTVNNAFNPLSEKKKKKKRKNFHIKERS